MPHRVEIILSPAASACSRWFAPTERILYFPAGSGCHCNTIQSSCNTQPPRSGDTRAARSAGFTAPLCLAAAAELEELGRALAVVVVEYEVGLCGVEVVPARVLTVPCRSLEY